MLKIEHLTKLFHAKKVLNNVSLSVDKGQIAVLLGSSGVGKSTLLRILNNLETYDQGNVFLDGKKLDLAMVNKDHTIGMVFQNFNLFEHLTVEQNIALALEKVQNKSGQEARNIALDLLAHYDLRDKANAYVSQLSGGQKQRLAIARTLALKPKVICLDEPTSALDPLLSNHVATTIQGLAQEGFIVLVTTHDVRLLEKLHCIIHLMKDGKIIESVQSDLFFKDREQYKKLNDFVLGTSQIS